jgi:hypothetical protein
MMVKTASLPGRLPQSVITLWSQLLIAVSQVDRNERHGQWSTARVVSDGCRNVCVRDAETRSQHCHRVSCVEIKHKHEEYERGYRCTQIIEAWLCFAALSTVVRMVLVEFYWKRKTMITFLECKQSIRKCFNVLAEGGIYHFVGGAKSIGTRVSWAFRPAPELIGSRVSCAFRLALAAMRTSVSMSFRPTLSILTSVSWSVTHISKGYRPERKTHPTYSCSQPRKHWLSVEEHQW